jgi:hypothetical protein
LRAAFRGPRLSLRRVSYRSLTWRSQGSPGPIPVLPLFTHQHPRRSALPCDAHAPSENPRPYFRSWRLKMKDREPALPLRRLKLVASRSRSSGMTGSTLVFFATCWTSVNRLKRYFRLARLFPVTLLSFLPSFQLRRGPGHGSRIDQVRSLDKTARGCHSGPYHQGTFGRNPVSGPACHYVLAKNLTKFSRAHCFKRNGWRSSLYMSALHPAPCLPIFDSDHFSVQCRRLHRLGRPLQDRFLLGWAHHA